MVTTTKKYSWIHLRETWQKGNPVIKSLVTSKLKKCTFAQSLLMNAFGYRRLLFPSTDQCFLVLCWYVEIGGFRMPISSGAAGRVGVGVDTSITWPPSGVKQESRPSYRNCDSYLKRWEKAFLLSCIFHYITGCSSKRNDAGLLWIVCWP